MSALTDNRDTLAINDPNDPYGTGEADLLDVPVAASTTIYGGSLVCLSGGYAVPGSTAHGLTALGMAEYTVRNTGAAGAKRIRVRQGIFRWENSASSDLIAVTDVGKHAFIVDDQTVAKTNGTRTRSPAGIIHRVDDDGVWVATRYGLSLMYALTLGDVGDGYVYTTNAYVFYDGVNPIVFSSFRLPDQTTGVLYTFTVENGVLCFNGNPV